MRWQPPEGMDEYLRPTAQCDSDNEEIKKKAAELTGEAKMPKEAAISIFRFVRDEITYAGDFTDVKASQTLKKRFGACFNKTKLQVALLRAVGIPARFHRVANRTEVVKGIFTALDYKFSPRVVNYHPWCECYLAGKWVSCESMLDKALFEGMAQRGLAAAKQIPTIDWDGENDLIVIKPWIVEDLGAFASLDDLWTEVEKKEFTPRIFRRAMMSLSNRHADGIRKR